MGLDQGIILVEIGRLVHVLVFYHKMIAPKQGQTFSKTVIGDVRKSLFLPNRMIIAFVFPGVVELLIVPLTPFGSGGYLHIRCPSHDVINHRSRGGIQVKVNVG